MEVIHVLKDGTEVSDIKGHVIRFEDASTLYELIRKINRRSDSPQKSKVNNHGGLSYEH